jgi:hypothetical protein
MNFDCPPQASTNCTIHELAGKGDCAGLNRLLAAGTAVDERDDIGCTALHFAADRGSLEAMALLLDAGAEVGACDEDGSTPLHYAALCGHPQVRAPCAPGCCLHARLVRCCCRLCGAEVAAVDGDGGVTHLNSAVRRCAGTGRWVVRATDHERQGRCNLCVSVFDNTYILYWGRIVCEMRRLAFGGI